MDNQNPQMGARRTYMRQCLDDMKFVAPGSGGGEDW